MVSYELLIIMLIGWHATALATDDHMSTFIVSSVDDVRLLDSRPRMDK